MAASRVAVAGLTLPAWAQTAGRAVHVKIHPRPLDLAESREVLRVLQQYGEVIMYKQLKHEPNLHAMNSAAAIYQNADAAQNAINASPLRFELKRVVSNSAATGSSMSMNTSAADETHGSASEAEDSDQKGEWLKPLQRGRRLMKEPGAGNMSLPGPNASPDGLNARYTQANSIPTSPPRTPKPFTSNPTPSSATPTSLPYPPTPPSSSTKEVSKEFHLTIERSVLNHHAYIQRQHYYGGFELDKTHMMVQDLAARVPVRGMDDCQPDKGEVPLRVRVKRGEEANGRETLRDMWNEGRRQRGKVHTNDSISEPMTP